MSRAPGIAPSCAAAAGAGVLRRRSVPRERPPRPRPGSSVGVALAPLRALVDAARHRSSPGPERVGPGRTRCACVGEERRRTLRRSPRSPAAESTRGGWWRPRRRSSRLGADGPTERTRRCRCRAVARRTNVVGPPCRLEQLALDDVRGAARRWSWNATPMWSPQPINRSRTAVARRVAGTTVRWACEMSARQGRGRSPGPGRRPAVGRATGRRPVRSCASGGLRRGSRVLRVVRDRQNRRRRSRRGHVWTTGKRCRTCRVAGSPAPGTQTARQRSSNRQARARPTDRSSRDERTACRAAGTSYNMTVKSGFSDPHRRSRRHAHAVEQLLEARVHAHHRREVAGRARETRCSGGRSRTGGEGAVDGERSPPP